MKKRKIYHFFDFEKIEFLKIEIVKLEIREFIAVKPTDNFSKCLF